MNEYKIGQVSFKFGANTAKNGSVRAYVVHIGARQFRLARKSKELLTSTQVLAALKDLADKAQGKKAIVWFCQQLLALDFAKITELQTKERSDYELMRSYERTNKLAEVESSTPRHKSGKGGSRANRGLEIYLNNKI